MVSPAPSRMTLAICLEHLMVKRTDLNIWILPSVRKCCCDTLALTILDGPLALGLVITEMVGSHCRIGLAQQRRHLFKGKSFRELVLVDRGALHLHLNCTFWESCTWSRASIVYIRIYCLNSDIKINILCLAYNRASGDKRDIWF